MAKIETLFITRLYRAELPRGINAALAKACLAISREDKAGRRWARQHGYRGYTSYASLDDLILRATVFAELENLIAPHVRSFAKALDFDRPRLELDSLWINVMPAGGVHAAHIHPRSVISGTYYIQVPKHASAIRFEDPRLPLMMAAPSRRASARRENKPFVTVEPNPGTLLLWESFVRHDVPLNRATGTRISLSFNYA
jgi:uncharacterized protein (TIGR02466 family)